VVSPGIGVLDGGPHSLRRTGVFWVWFSSIGLNGIFEMGLHNVTYRENALQRRGSSQFTLGFLVTVMVYGRPYSQNLPTS